VTRLLLAVLVGAAVVLGVLRALDDGDAAPASAASAGAFADSVGVNVHVTYSDTAYASFERVRGALLWLGARHVRDGVVLDRPDQVERLLALGRDGIRATMISGAPGIDLERVLEVLRRIRPVLAAVEGPNEFDAQGGRDWPEQLRRYQRRLYDAVRSDATLRRLPVFGPTFIEHDSRRALGDLRGALDRGNLHPYPGGGPPEPSLESERRLAAVVSGNEPLVATENGYHNAVRGPGSAQPGVSEAVAAEYAPRLYLSAFAVGIERTYWYELLDQRPDPEQREPESSFGLFREDGTPKPAAQAIRALLRVTRDHTGGEGAAGNDLEVSVRAGGVPVERLLLAKRDGSHVLALWRPVRVDDDATLAQLRASPRMAEVSFAEPVDRVAVHRPSRPDAAVERRRDTREVRVPLAGDAVLLEIRR